MKLEDVVVISAAVEDVFDAWAALERSPEHQKPTIERRKRTDGPVRAGTGYQAIDKWPGRKVSLQMAITDYDRPRRLAAAWEDPIGGAWSPPSHPTPQRR